MKTREEILDELITFHSSVQTDITDYSPSSVTRGIFFSFAAQLEALYAELEEIKKQSYIVTAEGLYLDRLIEGPFGLKRNPELGSTGYVVFYANSPIENAGEVEIFCATQEASGTISGLEYATRVVASGADTGKNFVVLKPSNPAVTELVQLDNGEFVFKLKLGELTHYQYLVLPVASVEKGFKANVQEGSISVISSQINGLDGVINTTDLRSSFLGESDVTSEVPFSVRFTLASNIFLSPDRKNSIISTSNASYFSQDSVIGLEDDRGTPWMAIYAYQDDNGRISETRFVEERLRFEYDQAQAKYLRLLKGIGVEELSVIESEKELPVIYKYDNLGYAYKYILQKVYIGNKTTRLLDFSRRPKAAGETFRDSLPGIRLRSFLEGLFTAGVTVRQLQLPLDAGLVFDPDRVVTKDGLITSSAVVGGGKDIETDPAYRVKLQKYLASLARATVTAVEVGALTVAGITYAQVFPDYTLPRGTVVMLVASPDGTVSGKKLNAVYKEVDKNWKAAGVKLILKTPEKVETTLVLQVTLKKGYLRRQVNDKLNFELNRYFQKKLPGDAISYSEVISIIQGVEGVLSTWSVLFGKRLTNKFYLLPGNRIRIYGGGVSGYVYELVKLAFASPFLHSNPLFSSSYFSLPSIEDKIDAPGIFLRHDSQTSGVISDTIWDEFVRNLVLSATNAEDFSRFVLKNRQEIFQTPDLTYELASFLSEPLDKKMVGTQSKIPLDPDYVNLDQFKSFKLTDTQVPALYSVILERHAVPVVGIQYLLEG